MMECDAGWEVTDCQATHHEGYLQANVTVPHNSNTVKIQKAGAGSSIGHSATIPGASITAGQWSAGQGHHKAMDTLLLRFFWPKYFEKM